MVDVTQQQARLCAVRDHRDIPTNAHGPEMLIASAVWFVEVCTGISGIYLWVERLGFNGFLFVTGEFGEAGSEGVGDQEAHSDKGRLY